MAMPWSVHVRGSAALDPATDARVAAMFALVRAADETLSPFRPDSALSALRRGELALAAAPATLREVETLCRAARERTGGWFDAWAWRDGFDPTGLTKGWALGRAVTELGDLGDVAVYAGGDVAVCSASGEPWRVAIEDPRTPGSVLAGLDLTSGAVCTSGPAARGAHIVDPLARVPATGLLSATVVHASALWADVWATTLVARGSSSAPTTREMPGTSGLLLTVEGDLTRWSHPE